MKIAIICASDDELAPFLKALENVQISEKAMLRFYESQIENVEIVTLYCGVGKVNAALATQILIDTFHVDIIINAGTAGAICNTLKLFDTVISKEIAYHDVQEDILTEFHPYLPTATFFVNNKLLDIAKIICQQNQNTYLGKIITSDSFIDKGQHEALNKNFAALCVDMESASIAHVCYVNAIDFIVIRTITDTPVLTGHQAFEQNCKKASDQTKDIVFKFINMIKKQWH